MSDANGKLHLEDFAVGQQFHAGPLDVTEADVIAFATQFDPQPFHLDHEAAKDSLFKGLAASGWHTAAMTMRMLVDGGAPIAGGIIGAGGEVSWPRPTYPGDRLRVITEILEIKPSRSKPTQGFMKVRTTTFNQKDEPVQILTANMLAFTKPA